MAAIILATLNARYVHASLGLRYLAANLGELESETRIMEFVLGMRPVDIVEALLKESPRIVGLGVYIWNAEEMTRVAAMLKAVAPEVAIVAGGPEVSHEVPEQRIAALADYVVTGWGETSFAGLCRDLLGGHKPRSRIIAGEQAPLGGIAFPYRLYGGEDIARRFLYVEASRGCPFKCEFCLSSLDKTAWPFDTERFLAEMRALYDRGARHFRFVDRTFNLNVGASLRILEFFLERMDERLFVHFELVPDYLPEKLRAAIARFPQGSLQFEIGIQTFNPEVQALISRRQDNAKAAENFLWLREHSNALIHADLIAGLPGEDLKSFGRGFDRLLALRPHEIQVGVLKRLRGTPIARHTEAHRMRYNPDPPYNVLATARIGFGDLQRMTRFARYWELVGNSGRFPRALALLLGEGRADSAFWRFMGFSDWLFGASGKTHEFALERLFELLHAYLTGRLGVASEAATEALAADYGASGARGRPAFLRRGTSVGDAPRTRGSQRAPMRQLRRARG
ncbi:MAG: DUF4080 domain-containing protein [Betaproteobacteria bacterium]|nr:DUF4080 domain-containing protein [Betaproteobacteria bacterium]